MNYEKLYNNLIVDRRANPPIGYSEKHHIIPRCEGGTNDFSNMIRLSARDHIFAHLFLAKWKGGKHWAAVYFLSTGRKGNKVLTSQSIRIMARAKEQWGLSLIGNTRGKGYKLSDEHKAKIGEAARNHKYSAEARKKMSEQRKGRSLSPEHKAKIGKAHKGRRRPSETGLKISAALKGRRFSLEHRAKLSTAAKARNLNK